MVIAREQIGTIILENIGIVENLWIHLSFVPEIPPLGIK